MSDPKALLIKIPQVRMAVRKPSSLRLYHFERRNTAPYHSVRTSAKHSPGSAYRQKCTLANTQEEAGQECTGKGMGNSGQGRYETPSGHTSGEVYRGFPEMIEEHVSVSS